MNRYQAPIFHEMNGGGSFIVQTKPGLIVTKKDTAAVSGRRGKIFAMLLGEPPSPRARTPHNICEGVKAHELEKLLVLSFGDLC